jgi:hypothetical protein
MRASIVAVILWPSLSEHELLFAFTKREQEDLSEADGAELAPSQYVGHAAVGALIGGPIGLIAGALIGDQLMDKTQRQTASQINQNQAEINRLRRRTNALRSIGENQPCIL